MTYDARREARAAVRTFMTVLAGDPDLDLCTASAGEYQDGFAASRAAGQAVAYNEAVLTELARFQAQMLSSFAHVTGHSPELLVRAFFAAIDRLESGATEP